MTTATAEQQNGTAPSILGGWRPAKKTGMPTSGLFLIVGLEKSGKSALMASAPDSVLLELDKGDADHLAGRIVDIEAQSDGKTALNVFRDAFWEAMEDPKIKVVGIDTFNTLVNWIGQEIAESHGLKSMLDRKEGVNGYGLWDELNAGVDAFINAAKSSGKIVVVAAHSKAPELDEDKRVVVPMGLDCYAKPSSKIAKRADLIGYAYKKEVGGAQEYRLSFKGGPLGAWGSRVETLNDKEIKMDKKDPWGSLVAAANGVTAAAAPAPAEKKTEAKASKRK